MNVIDMIKDKINIERERKGRAIVFWYDPNEQETLETLEKAFPEISVRPLTERNFFTLKLEIELEKPKESFLLYSNNPKPEHKNNYLLDILMYGTEFKSDDTALLAEVLSINDHILRKLMQQYPLFFKNKERKMSLGRVLPSNASEEILELSILAVLTGSKVPEARVIAKNILLSGLTLESNELVTKIVKFYSWDRTVKIIQQYFGILLEKSETILQELMEILYYQHFRRNTEWQPKEWEAKWNSTSPNICALFIDDWMNSNETEQETLQKYLMDWETKHTLGRILHSRSIEEIEKITTVPVVDALIIEKYVAEFDLELIDADMWLKRINNRLITYWGRKSSYISIYRALYHATKMVDYKNKFTCETDTDVYDKYAKVWYLVDQAYRKFMYCYTKIDQREWLKDIPLKITNWYENEFLVRLGQETNLWLEQDSGTKLKKQTSFYHSYISDILDKETTRVFVIISDALRYESAVELKEKLNLHTNGKAHIQPMLASLPSYTKLGMASLLPHKLLTIRDNGIVLADGQSTDGLNNRQRVIQSNEPKSAAWSLSEFQEWTRQESEEKLKGKRLIYLYHDVIDAIGDTRKTERETYGAVEKAIEDLNRAVSRLSSLQAKRIFITADHGFLFQFKQIENHGKINSPVGNKFDGNRRFFLGRQLEIVEGSFKLNSSQTPIQDTEVLIAKGINRFIGGGGLQFIHGGAMPQELVIPVIDYRRIEKGTPVEISVAVIDKLITNYRVPVTFYQEQSIGDSYSPRSIKVAFYKGKERISNEFTLEFNITGDNSERTRSVEFTLAENYYRLGDTCSLVMHSIEGDKITNYKMEEFVLRLYEAFY